MFAELSANIKDFGVTDELVIKSGVSSMQQACNLTAAKIA